jgi:hypothetical protein
VLQAVQEAQTMRGKFSAGEYDNGGEIVPCALEWGDWMGPVFGAMAADGDAYFMANDKQIFAAHGAATPNRWFMKNCEFTLYCWKGRAQRVAGQGGPFFNALMVGVAVSAWGALEGAAHGAIHGGSSADEGAVIGAAVGGVLGLGIGAVDAVIDRDKTVRACVEGKGYSVL